MNAAEARLITFNALRQGESFEDSPLVAAWLHEIQKKISTAARNGFWQINNIFDNPCLNGLSNEQRSKILGVLEADGYQISILVEKRLGGKQDASISWQ